MTLKRRTELKRTTVKRVQPKRDWGLALQKVEEEGQCRVCGTTEGLQAAHVTGRRHDPEVTGPRGGKVIVVLAESIVPLCGPFANDCHGQYDRHELDLLPYLRVEEQAMAVTQAGGITSALQRVSGRGEA